jgi:hypothetical protein
VVHIGDVVGLLSEYDLRHFPPALVKPASADSCFGVLPDLSSPTLISRLSPFCTAPATLAAPRSWFAPTPRPCPYPSLRSMRLVQPLPPAFHPSKGCDPGLHG